MAEHRAEIKITKKSVAALYDRQRGLCALTGEKLTPENASLDHIIPISRGGTHTIENAQMLLYEVNRMKGTLTNDEFIELCAKVAAKSSFLG